MDRVIKILLWSTSNTKMFQANRKITRKLVNQMYPSINLLTNKKFYRYFFFQQYSTFQCALAYIKIKKKKKFIQIKNVELKHFFFKLK